MIPIPEGLSTFIMVVGILPAVAVIYFLWDHREKPGVIWLIVASVGFVSWGVSFTMIFSVQIDVLKLFFTYLFVISPFTTASAWFMFSYEFTSKKPVPRWAYSFFALSIFAFVLALLNPLDIMFRSNPINSSSLFPSDPSTVRFLLNVVVAYSLVFFGTGMVIGEGMRTRHIQRRKQAMIVFSTALILVLMSLIKVFNIVPSYFDPTPLAVSFGFLLLSYSIHKHGLGKQVSIAREQTVELSSDAMIVTDANGNIIDINKATKSIFGKGIYGVNIGRLFNPKKDILTFNSGNVERRFKLDRNQIEYGRGGDAMLFILSEVTEIKERESELDMVQKIMQRVFRHNVRNKLTPILGHAQILKSDEDEKVRKNAKQIVENAHQLGNTSEKAIEIGDVINHRETSTKNIGKEVQKAINGIKEDYPSSDLKVSIEKDFETVVHPEFYRAIEEIMENGIIHSDTSISCLEISMRETPQYYQIWLADDGKGIPEIEVNAISENIENSTEHSDGAGLWLFKWVLERSRGKYDFYTHPEIRGTVTKIEIPKR